MPIERSKRNRENESESETQGRGDTVKQFNQEHTTKRKKTKDQDKCEMENNKKEKNHFGNHFRERQETKEKKIRQSMRSTKNGSCMQTGNNKRRVHPLCNMVGH